MRISAFLLKRRPESMAFSQFPFPMFVLPPIWISGLGGPRSEPAIAPFSPLFFRLSLRPLLPIAAWGTRLLYPQSNQLFHPEPQAGPDVPTSLLNILACSCLQSTVEVGARRWRQPLSSSLVRPLCSSWSNDRPCFGLGGIPPPDAWSVPHCAEEGWGHSASHGWPVLLRVRTVRGRSLWVNIVLWLENDLLSSNFRPRSKSGVLHCGLEPGEPPLAVTLRIGSKGSSSSSTPPSARAPITSRTAYAGVRVYHLDGPALNRAAKRLEG